MSKQQQYIIYVAAVATIVISDRGPLWIKTGENPAAVAAAVAVKGKDRVYDEEKRGL